MAEDFGRYRSRSQPKLMRVSIVDCGVGNLQSVHNALAHVGAEPEIVATPEAILAAERLVLPGVGAAGRALEVLRRGHLDAALDEAVRRNGRPLLGICVGMQILASTLHEFGIHCGLAWVDGNVVDLACAAQGRGVRVPHMGWSGVEIFAPGVRLFENIRGERSFYFCHSYALLEASEDKIAARATHGIPFVAALCWQTVFATQFHPEKSQVNGEKLLSAFLDWAP